MSTTAEDRSRGQVPCRVLARHRPHRRLPDAPARPAVRGQRPGSVPTGVAAAACAPRRGTAPPGIRRTHCGYEFDHGPGRRAWSRRLRSHQGGADHVLRDRHERGGRQRRRSRLASDIRSGNDSRRVGIASPWGFDATTDCSHSYAELGGILRQLQDLVACGQPTDSRARQARDHLGQALALLEEFREQPGGLNVRGDISGRDDLLIVPVSMVRWNKDSAEGTAQFSPFHHGGGGGVHGGVIALLFDDFIGRLANFQQITRTAYIHVNYHAVCPIGRNLVIRAGCAS
jgi:hypothetical protein